MVRYVMPFKSPEISARDVKVSMNLRVPLSYRNQLIEEANVRSISLNALLVLAVVFFSVRGRYLAPLAAALNLQTVRFLPVELGMLLIFGGMAVGCVGGAVAAWRR